MLALAAGCASLAFFGALASLVIQLRANRADQRRLKRAQQIQRVVDSWTRPS